MKILITGAAGFIGSHLCEALVKDNQLIGLDNFCDFYDLKLKRQNVSALGKQENFKLIKADIRDIDQLEDIFALHDFDLVIHLAAMAGVRPSIENPQLYTEVNLSGTVNLLEECRKHQVKRFIFASSSSVYGNNRKVPFAESDPVDHPISPYAATKKAGELICHTYHHLHGISLACLRFFTVYGPRQRPDLAIRKFAVKMLQSEKIPVFGSGDSERDYTYIDDIIDGIVKAVDFVMNNQSFEIFNLGESQTISLNKMIETLEKTLQIKAKRNILPSQLGDVEKTYADLTKSRQILGYDPQTDFNRGISKFCEWLKEQ